MGFTIVDIVVRMLSICCQIPHFDDLSISRHETADTSASTWMWACFVAGVAFLSLSLATGIWLTVKL
jgi:hypothetical protein